MPASFCVKPLPGRRRSGSPHTATLPRAERLFGNVDADASDATFTFGREGKPFYMSGPNDTPAQSRQRMAQLTKAVGAGNFDYMSVVGGLDGELDDDEDGDLGSEMIGSWRSKRRPCRRHIEMICA